MGSEALSICPATRKGIGRSRIFRLRSRCGRTQAVFLTLRTHHQATTLPLRNRAAITSGSSAIAVAFWSESAGKGASTR